MPGISLPLDRVQERWRQKHNHAHPTMECYKLCKLSQNHLEETSGGEQVQSLVYKRASFRLLEDLRDEELDEVFFKVILECRMKWKDFLDNTIDKWQQVLFLHPKQKRSNTVQRFRRRIASYHHPHLTTVFLMPNISFAWAWKHFLFCAHYPKSC